MNREEYLEQLRKRIKNLSNDDIDDAMSYYIEYFEEANDDIKVIQSLGSPIFVANQILAENAIKEIDENPGSMKKGLSASWLSIKTVLSAPIPIFSMILLGLMILIGVIVIAGIAISAYTVTISCGGFGLYSIYIGFNLFGSDISTGIVFMGAGVFLLGFCLLSYILSIALSRLLISFMIKVSKSLLEKVKKER